MSSTAWKTPSHRNLSSKICGSLTSSISAICSAELAAAGSCDERSAAMKAEKGTLHRSWDTCEADEKCSSLARHESDICRTEGLTA